MGNLINKIFLTGMIGAGSLIGANGYGQRTFDKTREIPEVTMITVIASLVNHQKFQIDNWKEFSDGTIVLKKYFDTNYD